MTRTVSPSTKLHRLLWAASFGVLLLATASPSTAADSSLTELEIEAAAANKALETAVNDNAKLREKLEQAERTIAQMQKNLAIANGEAEVFRRNISEFKLRLEALGLDGAGGSTSKLEQRLLTAVSDLKVVDDERRKLKDALIGLSEAVIHYQKVTVTTDADARLKLEAQMRAAAQALGAPVPENPNAPAAPATLTDGRVISIKEDLGLIVTNLGTSHGAKVGMPFQVLRDSRVLGTVRVVDVRDKIAGAVIQDLTSEGEKFQVGDRIKVLAQQ